ncbi:hypothetical protein [Natrinema sp. 74]|uniref:hypothetical protein n=1 Tax=Natrinema sp. 74 TaxID=3384159 RepID=UPI0038D426B9
MSAPDGRLPATTRRAIALAAGVGTLALAVFEPMVVLGVGLGLALAVSIGLFAGSYRRVALGSAFVPLIVGGGIVAVAVIGAPVPGLVTAVSMIVAVAAAGVVTGWPRPAVLVRAGAATLCAAVVAAAAALLALGVDSAGGPRSALDAVLWVTGDGMVGTGVAIGAACVTVIGALVLVPQAAVTRPQDRSSYVSSRNGLAAAIAVATVLALAALFVLAILSSFAAPLRDLADAIGHSAVVHGLLTTVTAVAIAVSAFAVVVRWSWLYTEQRRNVVVPIVAGAVAGVGFAAAGAIGVTGSAGRSAVFLGATAVVLGLGWSAAWVAEGAMRKNTLPAIATVLAVALAAGGVVVGATVDVVTLGLETVRAGGATVVAIATASFAFDAGRYGRGLGREIGPSASRRPQLVRLGWSAAVAGVGLLAAALGLAVATLLAPTLSIPATAGAVAALLALLAGAWLLVR